MRCRKYTTENGSENGIPFSNEYEEDADESVGFGGMNMDREF